MVPLGLLAAAAHAERPHCEPWCIDAPCFELNGNVQDECSACGPADHAMCGPGRPGFAAAEATTREAREAAAAEATEVRTARLDAVAAMEALQLSAAAADGSSAADVERACARLPASALRGLSPEQLAATLTRPAILVGAIDDWPAHRLLGTPEAVGAALGSHGVLSKRINFAAERAQRAGLDPERTLVRLADLAAALDAFHVVIYPGEPGNAPEEVALVEAVADHTAVPDVLARTETTVLSLGGGPTGVQMATHGFAWIGLVAGRKVWYLDAPGGERPADPTCARGADDLGSPSEVICAQLPGEVIVVPSAWWHATCNTAPFTLGVGGQDSCDIADCTPPGPPDETAHQYHMRMKFCPHPERSAECYRMALMRDRAQLAATRERARSGQVNATGWLPLGLPSRETMETPP